MAAMVVYLLLRRPTTARGANKMIRLLSRLPHPLDDDLRAWRTEVKIKYTEPVARRFTVKYVLTLLVV